MPYQRKKRSFCSQIHQKMAKKTRRTKKTKKKKKFGIGETILLIVNIFFILLLLLANLAPILSPEKYFYISTLGLVYPLLIIANLVFIIVWLLRFRYSFVFSLIAIAISYGNVAKTFGFTSKKLTLDQNEYVSVMSYNVKLFDYFSHPENEIKKSVDGIIKLVNDNKVEILCLQEFYDGSQSGSNTLKLLSKNCHLPFTYVETIKSINPRQPFGLAILSKYPIVNQEKINFDNSKVNYAIKCDVLVGNDTLNLINTHLESIKLGKEDYNLMSEIIAGTTSNEQIKKSSKSILKKLETAYERRIPQVSKLQEVIDKCNKPLILVGDFNDTPVSYTYRIISKNLKDSFKEAGWGFGKTYAEKIPLLRIDYIFFSNELNCAEFEVISSKISDHYPILSKFSIK